MKKIFKTIGIFSIVALMTGVAFSQPQNRSKMRPGNRFSQQGRMMRPGGHMAMRSPMRMITVLKARQAELKITDAQLEEIENLMYAFQKKQIKVQSEAGLLRLEMRKLMQEQGSRDYSKVKAFMEKSAGIRQDMVIERMKHQDEVLSVLTPEQQQAVKALRLQRFQGNKMSMRGKRGSGRMGDKGFSFMRDGSRRSPMMKNRIIK